MSTNTLARIKAKGKNFEIMVDLDYALKLKKGENVNMQNVLSVDGIFSDSKKGLRVSDKDLLEGFGTKDIYSIAEKIIKSGEIQLPQDYREGKREERIKQVIDFLARNAVNPTTGKPHTPERIKQAIEQAGVNIDNKPVEEQISKVVDKIKTIIPIKFETKKLKIKIPANYSGNVYGILKDYKEKEEWLSDGSLEVIVNLPVGMQMSFYDKLNSITHGSNIVEEIK